MTSLFTYRVTHDTGFAPNPFWGLCTLVTCKPTIRRVAQVGDWIAGFGCADSPHGDTRSRLIYAMRVTGKMTMEEYDALTRRELPNKIPDMSSDDHRFRSGDSIFDFASGRPVPRPSRHSGESKTLAKDLRGGYALLSNDFWYFGDDPIPLPTEIALIIPQDPGRGHRSDKNDPFVSDFVSWIRSVRPKGGSNPSNRQTRNESRPRPCRH